MSTRLIPKPTSVSTTLSLELAARALGVNPRGVKRLLDSAYLPDLDLQRVAVLAQAPALFALAGDVQPVLRQGPAAYSDEEQRLLGESASYSDDQVVEASSRWWRIDAAAALRAELLPVSVAGFITSVLHLQDVEEVAPVEHKGGGHHMRVAFRATLAGRVDALGDPSSYRVCDVPPHLAETVQSLLGARSTGVAGGPIAYLAEDTSSTTAVVGSAAAVADAAA